MTKEELRKRMIAARDALAPAEVAALSARIADGALGLDEVKACASVFTYVSHGNEVDTRALIERLLAAGMEVLVPAIVGDGIMEAHRIRSLADLEPGRFGILAPRARDRFPATPDVCICPGVAFSPLGDRLGRGKGYYDRFLALHPSTFAVGLAFEVQVTAALPVTLEDRRVDAIVTEDRTIRTGGAE